MTSFKIPTFQYAGRVGDLSNDCRREYKTLSLETVDEPPLSHVVSVGINEFGYIGPSEARTQLDTFGLSSCIGVHINAKETTGYQLLMHCCTNWSIRAALLVRYASEHKMMLTDVPGLREPASIYASSEAERKDVESIIHGFHEMGCRNYEVVTSPETRPIDIIVNSDGQKYWLGTLQPRLEDELECLRIGARAFSPDTLYCVNTNETIEQDIRPLYRHRIPKELSPELTRYIDEVLSMSHGKNLRVPYANRLVSATYGIWG